MFAFTDSERIYLTELRAITSDEKGREVLVGLTLEQTAFCMDHQRRSLTKDRERDRDHKQKYLVLMENHRRALYAVLGDEIRRRKK